MRISVTVMASKMKPPNTPKAIIPPVRKYHVKKTLNLKLIPRKKSFISYPYLVSPEHYLAICLPVYDHISLHFYHSCGSGEFHFLGYH